MFGAWIAAALLALGAGPGPLHPQAVVSSHGVQARLLHTTSAGRPVRLEIRRRGSILLSRRVPPWPGEHYRVDPTWQRPLLVRDLDDDGEPEVVLRLNWGGTQCCAWWRVYTYRPRQRRYTASQRPPALPLPGLAGRSRVRALSLAIPATHRLPALTQSLRWAHAGNLRCSICNGYQNAPTGTRFVAALWRFLHRQHYLGQRRPNGAGSGCSRSSHAGNRQGAHWRRSSSSSRVAVVRPVLVETRGGPS